MTNEKAHILPEGTRVRVTERSVSGDRDVDPTAGRPGDEYDVWSYAGPGEGPDALLGMAHNVEELSLTEQPQQRLATGLGAALAAPATTAEQVIEEPAEALFEGGAA